MPTLDQRWLPLNIPRCALTQKARAGIAREGREFTGPLSHKKPGPSSREDAVKRRPRFQPGPGARKRHPGKTVFNSTSYKTSLLTFSIPHRPSMPRSKFIDLLPLRSCRFSTDRWRPHTTKVALWKESLYCLFDLFSSTSLSASKQIECFLSKDFSFSLFHQFFSQTQDRTLINCGWAL